MLTRVGRAGWALLLAFLVGLVLVSPAAADGDGCPRSNPNCVVVDTGDDHHGGGGDTDPGGGDTGGSGSGPTSCLDRYEKLNEADSNLFLSAAHLDPALYDAYRSECPKENPGADGYFYNYLFPAKGEAPAPPPDPWEVARDVAARIELPDPSPHFGPDADQLAVNVPISLSVDDVTKTDTGEDRGLVITMTASIGSVAWSFGEPGSGQVVCDGAGSPSCSYTYSERSLPDRTQGRGTWTVTVTATWTLHWEANNGQSGDLTRPTTTTVQIYVGEWRTVIVPPR